MKRQKTSLIITVKNDSAGLEKLLVSLQQQTVLPDEICLSVAQSNDDTLKKAQELSQRMQMKIHVFSCGDATRSEGRNSAVDQSTGDILLFTDVGCRPKNNWVEHLVASFDSPQNTLVSGLTLGDPQNLWEEVQVPYVLVPPEKIAKHPLPATRNMAMRKEVWEAVGPFSPQLNFAEDFEWSRRAESLGVTSTFVSQAVVFWRPRATPLSFFTMLHRLAMGDMLAGTWRKGHASMWLRYIFFLGLIIFSLRYSYLITAIVGTGVWLTYASLKAAQFHFPHGMTYLLVPLAQLLADVAVLTGTARGLALRWFSGQNRTV